MNPPGPPEGPISPDGIYRWDGQQWVLRAPAPPMAPTANAWQQTPAPLPVASGPQFQPPSNPRLPIIIGVVAVAALAAIVGALAMFGNHSPAAVVVTPQAQPTAVVVPSFTVPSINVPTFDPGTFDTPTAAPGVVSGAYVPPDSLWKATFTGTPKYTTTTVPSASGSTIPYAYAEYANANHDQFVGVLTLPAGTTFSLKAGIDGIVSRSNGTLVSSSPTTFQGLPSYDGTISVGTEFIACRAVRSGNYVYVFGAAGIVNPPSDFAAFAASVKLTPH